MEVGQRLTDNSGAESAGCTPADRITDSDGDTPSDENHVEPVGIAGDSPQGLSEETGMEDAENVDVDEDSDGHSDGTDEEEGEGIHDMSQLGAGAVEVKVQTVHQQSYQLVGKDTKSLVQHTVGCCQSALGETASAPQHEQQLQPGPGDDGDGRTDRAHLSTSTTSGVPQTSPQVPGTSALTRESTSSLLPQIPGSLVSQIQSSGLPMTGDSTRVTQYNLIQVQQDFGDVTVKGGKNLNTGGTQNVGTTATNEGEDEKLLTAAQKIRKRTASRIQSWTKDMVETDALKKVKEKLDSGTTWVTIKGRPGEGKSTTAYMALKNLYNQGRQVYQVESPEEYNEVTMACKNAVIMLDDIFGDLEFDAAEWARWRPRLRPMVDSKNPDTCAEKDVLDISTKNENISDRTKIDQREVKQGTIIILVGRDYVLKSSLADLGRMTDYISSPRYVVEVSSQRASYERRRIWRVHAEAKNIDIEESIVSRICVADCPHGFPHVCKMFVAAYEKDWTHRQMQMFLQAPLDFLSQTLNKHLTDKIKRSLFMAMIKRDGKITGEEMEEDDNFGFEYIAAADNMVGSYLKKEDDTYMFDHPSIYDSVSFILSTKQPKFVIENCSLSFINQRLRLTPSGEEIKEKNIAGKTDLVANIPWTNAKHLARRFASEMQRSNLLHVLSHQSLRYSDFVDVLMQCLKTRFHMRASDVVKLTDNSSNKSFCELLSRSKSHHPIKYMMEKENISFTESEGRDILLGVCTNAACSILKYISGRMKLEVNATYGHKKKTPLMLAAETRDSEFVSQILSLDPDINARDNVGQTVFCYLCENGLASPLKHAINMGMEVKQHHGSFRQFLYNVIRKGHLEVVELLVNRGCDIDNQKGLECAIFSLNAKMVRYFLDRGAVILYRYVCKACEVGNRNIVEVLFENSSTLNIISRGGSAPLSSACKGNPAVASYLLKKGASVNQASNVGGDTALHVAAQWRSAECVDVLLRAGADANIQNNTGDTPLHRAAATRFRSKDFIDVLLEAGADANIQNSTGDTPLHRAAATIFGSKDLIDVLLKAGADVNIQNNTGDTPLHRAAETRFGSKDLIDVLLKAGADANIQNNTGDTPLHRAAALSSTSYADVLLRAGADASIQNVTGDTPLHRAAAALFGSKDLIDVLLKAGANAHIQNKTGDTPLHRAAGQGSAACFDVLLKAGADINVQNNTGNTPHHIFMYRAIQAVNRCFIKFLSFQEVNGSHISY